MPYFCIIWCEIIRFFSGVFTGSDNWTSDKNKTELVLRTHSTKLNVPQQNTVKYDLTTSNLVIWQTTMSQIDETTVPIGRCHCISECYDESASPFHSVACCVCVCVLPLVHTSSFQTHAFVVCVRYRKSEIAHEIRDSCETRRCIRCVARWQRKKKICVTVTNDSCRMWRNRDQHTDIWHTVAPTHFLHSLAHLKTQPIQGGEVRPKQRKNKHARIVIAFSSPCMLHLHTAVDFVVFERIGYETFAVRKVCMNKFSVLSTYVWLG